MRSGQHAVAGAGQPRHALDHDPRTAGAADPRPHLVEAIGDIDDFRFACGVLDHRGAAGERRRHERRMGAADSHLRKHHLAAAQSVWRACDHVSGFDGDLGTEALQRHDQKIDGAGADGAAARHRHLGLTHAGDQRRDDPKARPHFRDQLVGRGGIDDIARRDVQGLALIGGIARALAVEHHVDAVIVEDALQLRHVGEPRHIVEDHGLRRQQARDHQRQGGVLGARNRNGAVQRRAADDADTIHRCPPTLAPGCRREGRSPPAPPLNGGRQPYGERLSLVIWAESWGGAVGAASFETWTGSAPCGCWVCRGLSIFSIGWVS